MGDVLDYLFLFFIKLNYEMLKEIGNRRECFKRGDEKKTMEGGGKDNYPVNLVSTSHSYPLFP